MNSSPSVTIVGAGLSGLCLAQKLVAAGMDVRVYERDPMPVTRRQGYRITLDAHGIAALGQSLPKDLFDLAIATAATPAEKGYFTLTNARLGVVFRLTFRSDPSHIDLTTPRQVDRATLRAILLTGLEDRVLFGKRAIDAATDAQGVTVRFDDGDLVRSDIAVGADGVHSALRARLLPDSAPIDTGSVAIYGRCPLFADGACLVPESLENSGLLALGQPGHAFFFTTMRFGEPPQTAFSKVDPHLRAPVDEDYVMWALIMPTTDSPATLEDMTAEALHALALRHARAFHPALQRFVALADTDATVPVRLRAAPRPETWPCTRLALVGDAIHIMPPFESGGGNTALRDAALLGSRLHQGILRGDRLENVIAGYHQEMSAYAFPLVRSSMAKLGRVNMRNAFLRSILLGLLPAIRSMRFSPLLRLMNPARAVPDK